MTGLFPWEHICHFSGARPKAQRGITNEVVLLEGKLITNDDSNNGLGQNLKVDSAPAVLRFSPFKLKTGREQQGFLLFLSSSGSLQAESSKREIQPADEGMPAVRVLW